MEFKLNNGVILVDECDLSLLKKYHWYIVKNKHTSYVFSNIRNKNHDSTTIKMHRLIMNVPEGYVVDHINGDGLDNRRENLRVCKQLHNCWNTKISPKPYYRKDINKYNCDISINNHNIHLGYCDNEQESIKRFNEVHEIRNDFIDGNLSVIEANKLVHKIKMKYQVNTPKYVSYFQSVDKYVKSKKLRDEYKDYGPKPKNTKISKKDKEFIKNSSIKQIELAKMFNISPQYVNNIKKGRR